MKPRRERLQALRAAGVSIWLDTLSRDLLESGEFAAMVDACGVSGATSNPTIFADAITHSHAYDAQLRSLRADGVTDARELFLAAALDDVRRAAAILRPVHERSHGGDGFVRSSAPPSSPTTPRRPSHRHSTSGIASVCRTF